MKLPEALDVLLKAEDEALEMRNAGEREAKAVIQKTRDGFAREQESRLNAAREEARVQVESARHVAETQALQIVELAKRSREKMRERFEANVPALIAKMAEDTAAWYASRGRS